MGTEGSKEWETRRLPRDNWEQIPINSNRAIPYGQFNVFRSRLTGEQIEEYGVFLGSGEEKQKYLTRFMSRLQQEFQVNTRFIDIQSSSQFCGCGLYARVYTERIPLRLDELKELSQKESIYILHSVIKGYEELFTQYGYFRPTNKMIGVDKEGRIKVWINSDFSSHSKSCPLDLQRKFYPNGKTVESQDLIVWQILSLFREGGLSSQILPLLNVFQGRLSFSKVRQQLEKYPTNIKYLQSILTLITTKQQSSSAPESSHYDVSDISFHPQKTKDRIVYYVNPMDNSQLSSIQDFNEQDKVHSRRSLPAEVNKQFSGHSTENINRTQTKLEFTYTKKPRIPFNQQRQKIVYNGTKEQYELDPDLSEDLHKLLGKS